MPNLCNFQWIDEIDVAIRDRANAYGLPLDIAYAFVAAESAFFSYAGGDQVIGGSHVVGPDGHLGMVGGVFAFDGATPCGGVAWEGIQGQAGRFYASFGLNQLSTCGGQGSGMMWSQLVNPWTNCDVAFPPIASAFRACWSPTIGQETFIRCVMRNSGHPGFVPDGNAVFEAAFNNIWPKWLCFYQALVGGQIPPNPVIPPSPPVPTPPLPIPLPPLPPLPGTTPGGSNGALIPLLVFGAFAMVVIRRPMIIKKLLVKGDVKGGISKKKIFTDKVS